MPTKKPESGKPKSAPAPARPRRVSTAAAAPRTRSKKVSRGSFDARPDDERIRVRAYEISLQRGYHGDPMEDWLRAERELIEQTQANG